jgi:hypothetical protein
MCGGEGSGPSSLPKTAPSRYAIIDAANQLTAEAYKRLLDLVLTHGDGKIQPARFVSLMGRPLTEREVCENHATANRVPHSVVSLDLCFCGRHEYA